MKHEIFIITVLHLTSVAKSIPPPKSADSTKLQERLEPRDLIYDLSFGWFGANEDEGVLNPGIKIASQIHEDSKTETVQSLLRALEEESKHADSEQQKKILNLIQDFNKILIETPQRYAKILLNNVWHTIDMGVFGSTQRTRETMSAEKFIAKLKELIMKILALFYDYFTQENKEGKSRFDQVGQSQPEIDPWEVDEGSKSGSSGEHSSESESHGPTGNPGMEMDSKEHGMSESGSAADSTAPTNENGSGEVVQSGPGSGRGSGRGSGPGSGTGMAPPTSGSDTVASGEFGSDSTENGHIASGEMGGSSGEGSSTHEPSGVEAGSNGASSENPYGGELGKGGSSIDGSSRRGSLGGSTIMPNSGESGIHGGSTVMSNSGETGMQSSGEGFSESYDPNADVMKGAGNTNRPCPPQVKLSP